MTEQPKSVADLQRIANEAAQFSQNMDIILQSTATLEREWMRHKGDKNFPIGCVGLYSALSLRLKHGMTGQPPNPVFTRERFMDECATIYDALDVYYGAIMREKANETDNGPNGEGTRR